MTNPGHGEEAAPPPPPPQGGERSSDEAVVARADDASDDGGGGSDDNSADGGGGSDENSASDGSDSGEEGSDGDRISPEDGLSAETLRALLEFQAMGAGDLAEALAGDDKGGEDPAGGAASAPSAPPDAPAAAPAPVCVAYTAQDSLVIAQTLKRLQQKDEEQGKKLEDVTLPDPSHIPTLEEPVPPRGSSLSSSSSRRAEEEALALADALERDGAVRIDGVLSGGACDDCLGFVNDALGRRGAASIAEGGGGSADRRYGFGNVFSRRRRCDMYLRPDDPPCARALAELLDAEGSRLGRVLRVLAMRNRRTGPRRDGTDDGGGTDDDNDEDWYFHEFSALVADPGCQNQPLHPDAPYSPVAPLYTAFVALQDVGPDMGPTVVVPGTHRIVSVQEAIRGQNSNANLRDPASYRRALLGKGDCLLMDARTYHLGSANASATGRRRALLYLTLRNPRHGTEDSDFPPDGSLFDDLRGKMKLSDYSGANRKQANVGPPLAGEAAAASSGGEPAC